MFRKFVSYYKPYKKIFTLDMIASFVFSIIGMVYPIVTRYLLNDLIPNNKFNQIIYSALILLGLYIIRMLLKYFIQYQGHVMGVWMQADMRREIFEKLQRLPYTYFDNHETGKILSRITNDLQEVSELAHHGAEYIFICGFLTIGSFIYLGTINLYLAIIIFACVPILAVISIKLRKQMNSAFYESRAAVAQINGSIQSSISGIRVTKAYNNANKELEKFEIGNQDYVKAKSKGYKAMGQFSSSTSFVTDIFYVVILLAGGIFLYNKQITFGDYSAFIVSISMFITPLTNLINFVEQYENGVTGFKRFIEIIEQDEEIDDGTKELKDVDGDIKFEHVSFEYIKDQPILNDISFEIKSGETLALVGETGGGKTSICHLIPRFYRINSGSITIDNQDINDLTLKSLRDSIGIVQQDVFLFNGTIYENILYGRLDATKEEVIEASKNANIYDFIMSLPDGFETNIGERGVKLSGGQKQRLSIARVFLKNPKILILDEATSALDNTTEFAIQKALNNLSVGRTTIVVAHRLSTVKSANKIAVIEKGKIKEMGAHLELMNRNGVYTSLYNQQFANM